MNEHPAIKTLTQSCTAVAEELMQQREFFEFHRAELPNSEAPLPVARYSGARSDDEATNLRVGAMRLLGFSDRAIERECGVDRRTIPHRLAWLERAGRIPAQKERLLRIVGESAEKSGLILNTLLDQALRDPANSDLAAMIRSIATAHGIAVEKVQLLTGAPTEIVEQRAGAGRAEIEAFWKEAKVIEVGGQVVDLVAVDSASNGKPPEQATSGASELVRHGADTATDRPEPGQAELGPTDHQTADRREGGAGGVAEPGRVEKLHASDGSQNFNPLAEGQDNSTTP